MLETSLHGSTGAWSRYGFCCSASPLARSCASGPRSWRLRDGAGHEDVPLREGLAAAVAEKRPCALFSSVICFLGLKEEVMRSVPACADVGDRYVTVLQARAREGREKLEGFM
jgi:hypothetical protein